jgi:hypothetical protein
MSAGLGGVALVCLFLSIALYIWGKYELQKVNKEHNVRIYNIVRATGFAMTGMGRTRSMSRGFLIMLSLLVGISMIAVATDIWLKATTEMERRDVTAVAGALWGIGALFLIIGGSFLLSALRSKGSKSEKGGKG